VVLRRTRFELRKAEERAEILEGYLIALANLDEFIRIIRGSANREEARVKLLAFEFTPNSSNTNGGFFIDPNSPELLGRFGVGIGRSTSKNSAYFSRPSANTWHHYAIVFDSTATASQQVIPYVDGAAVSYLKLNSGTGAGAFANSTLYFMSRGASSLFGRGNLDEVALYNRALTAAEISAHFKAANP